MKISTIKKVILTDKNGVELHIGDSFYSTHFNCEYKIIYRNRKIILEDIHGYGEDLSLNEVDKSSISKIN